MRPVIEILSPERAAEYLCVSAERLAKLRVLGDGPLFFKIGRSVRYKKPDLDTWIAARSRRSTGDQDT